MSTSEGVSIACAMITTYVLAADIELGEKSVAISD